MPVGATAVSGATDEGRRGVIGGRKAVREYASSEQGAPFVLFALVAQTTGWRTGQRGRQTDAAHNKGARCALLPRRLLCSLMFDSVRPGSVRLASGRLGSARFGPVFALLFGGFAAGGERVRRIRDKGACLA